MTVLQFFESNRYDFPHSVYCVSNSRNPFRNGPAFRVNLISAKSTEEWRSFLSYRTFADKEIESIEFKPWLNATYIFARLSPKDWEKEITRYA